MIRGLAWLPDGSGIVYSSSRAPTVSYCHRSPCGTVSLDKTPPKQLMAADVWYEQPDVHASGLVSATRMRMRSDVWKFPFGPNAVENVSRREPVTRQTSHVLTPSAGRDGRVAYLSDSGGHANIWVKPIDGPARQITFEDDPSVTSASRSGRPTDMDCLRVVQGQCRARVRRVGRKARCRRLPSTRAEGARGRLVRGQPRPLLRRNRRPADEADCGVWRRIQSPCRRSRYVT